MTDAEKILLVEMELDGHADIIRDWGRERGRTELEIDEFLAEMAAELASHE